MKPKLLDLFCGAGGCARGYQMAGFEVRGIDHKPQPRYVGEEFIQADAFEYLAKLIASGEIEEFDVIHASPPCQAYSCATPAGDKKLHPDLIPDTRELLERAERPYVIENVIGAPLHNAIVLCGTMFGLKDTVENLWLKRHRIFESNIILFSPGGCFCSRVETAFIGGHMGKLNRHPSHGNHSGIHNARILLNIDWMKGDELGQAIPPAYTEYIGRQLLAAIEAREAAE